MPISKEIRDLHRLVSFSQRAKAAETQLEYEGYREMYSLARFLSCGEFSRYWGFSDIAMSEPDA